MSVETFPSIHIVHNYDLNNVRRRIMNSLSSSFCRPATQMFRRRTLVVDARTAATESVSWYDSDTAQMMQMGQNIS
jgi:hypothetical protein